VVVTLPGGIATAPQNLPNIHLILIWPEIGLAGWLLEPTGWQRFCLSRMQIRRSRTNSFRFDRR